MTGQEQKTKMRTHNTNITPCASNCEVFAIMGEAEVQDGLPAHHSGLNKDQSIQGAWFDLVIHHTLAKGDCPCGYLPAGIKQIYDRVIPTQGKVAAAGRVWQQCSC